MRATSFSLDEATREILDSLKKRSGLSKAEIIRRLVLAYAAGKSAKDIVPGGPIFKSAVDAIRKMKETP